LDAEEPKLGYNNRPTGGRVKFFHGKTGGENFLPGDGRTSGLSDRKRRAPS
jgi:hypothetical protein